INTATAGITGIDLGGSAVIANANIGYWQRGFTAIGSVAPDGKGGTTQTSWSNIMGGGIINGSTLSRAQGIMYSTPNFGGFTAAASYDESGRSWDAALRYAGEFSGFRLAGGIGYVKNLSGLGDITENTTDGLTNAGFVVGAEPSQWKGSASIL